MFDAQVNVLQSVVFASMSGSALADAAGSGKLMQEMMTRGKRYTPEFAAARHLYASEGFVTCGPFEGYTLDPFSTFMTRAL